MGKFGFLVGGGMLLLTGVIWSASVSGLGIKQVKKKAVETLNPGDRGYYRSGRYRNRHYGRVYIGGGMHGGK